MFVCVETLSEELVIRASNGGEHNLTRSSDWGVWDVCLGTPYEVPATVHFGGHFVEDIPVMGAVADHCGGYAFGTMTLASTSKDRASRIW